VTVLGGAPFTYGRPVQPGEFLGREAELRTIFNRLRNGESTAVTGEPQIGKSSLLLKLADEATQRDYLGPGADQLFTCSLDLHSVGSDYTPEDFWHEALEPLYEGPDRDAIEQQLDQVAASGYARRPLERLFNQLGQRGRRLVLLLDEFDRLLGHGSFQDPSFFALLRSLATRTNGLVLVIASHLSVSEINERGRGLLDMGSPFFNVMINVRLRPFDGQTAEELLERAGRGLSLDDRRFVRRVSGQHPFLLQALAATLLEFTGEDRHARTAWALCERICSHFDDLWVTLDDRARAAVVVLSLIELCNQAIGPEFDYRAIIRNEAFGAQLRNLRALALAERVEPEWPFDRRGLCLWRGDYWTISAQALAWWVLQQAIAGSPRIHTLSVPVDEGECSLLDLAMIHQILVEHFSMEELRTLCFELELEYEDLPGEGTAGKARELIGYLERRGRVQELMERGRRLRPNARWEDAQAAKAASCGLLPDRQYLHVLTQEQWDQLWGAVRSAPVLVNLRIGALARSLFEALREARQS
jgi:hypothetical protein